MPYEFGELTYGTPRASYVGSPLKEFEATSNVLAKKYKENLANRTLLETALANLKLTEPDNVHKANAIKKMEDTLANITESGRLEDAYPVLQQVAKEIGTDKALIAGQEYYANVEAQKASLKKQHETGKIPINYNLAATDLATKVIGIGQPDQLGFYKSGFSTEMPPDEPNYGDFVIKFLQGYKEDGKGKLTPQYDPTTGAFTGFSRDAGEFIGKDELRGALKSWIAGDIHVQNDVGYKMKHGFDMDSYLDKLIEGGTEHTAFDKSVEYFQNDPTNTKGKTPKPSFQNTVHGDYLSPTQGDVLGAKSPHIAFKAKQSSGSIQGLKEDRDSTHIDFNGRWYAYKPAEQRKKDNNNNPILGAGESLIPRKDKNGNQIRDERGFPLGAIVNLKEDETQYVNDAYNKPIEQLESEMVSNKDTEKLINKEAVNLSNGRLKLTPDGDIESINEEEKQELVSNIKVLENEIKKIDEGQDIISKNKDDSQLTKFWKELKYELKNEFPANNSEAKSVLSAKLVKFRTDYNNKFGKDDKILDEATKSVLSKLPQSNVEYIANTLTDEGEVNLWDRTMEESINKYITTNPTITNHLGEDLTNKLKPGSDQDKDLVNADWRFDGYGYGEVGKIKGFYFRVTPIMNKGTEKEQKGDIHYIDANELMKPYINDSKQLFVEYAKKHFSQPRTESADVSKFAESIKLPLGNDSYTISQKGKNSFIVKLNGANIGGIFPTPEEAVESGIIPKYKQIVEEKATNDYLGGSIAAINKSPYNIKGKSYGNVIGNDKDGHAQYSSITDGINAGIQLFKTIYSGKEPNYPKGDNTTLKEFATKYATNPAHADSLSKLLNIPLTTPLKDIPIKDLLRAAVQQEDSSLYQKIKNVLEEKLKLL